jgi:DNA-binding HxlR family transcriptional regulator
MPTDQYRATMPPGVRLVVNLLGDKWTVPIIHLLSPGPRRHAELRRGLPQQNFSGAETAEALLQALGT